MFSFKGNRGRSSQFHQQKRLNSVRGAAGGPLSVLPEGQTTNDLGALGAKCVDIFGRFALFVAVHSPESLHPHRPYIPQPSAIACLPVQHFHWLEDSLHWPSGMHLGGPGGLPYYIHIQKHKLNSGQPHAYKLRAPE